jgi:hypothetical protein
LFSGGWTKMNGLVHFAIDVDMGEQVPLNMLFLWKIAVMLERCHGYRLTFEFSRPDGAAGLGRLQ